MDKEVRRIKQGLGITFSELLYNGETPPRWSERSLTFTLSKEVLTASQH